MAEAEASGKFTGSNQSAIVQIEAEKIIGCVDREVEAFLSLEKRISKKVST
jgi:hypothetical protein